MEKENSTHIQSTENPRCTIVRQQLNLYLKSNLSAQEKALFEEHLKQCPFCQNYFNNFKEKIYPYIGAYIYPQNSEICTLKTGQRFIGNKKNRFDWKRIIPNILTALSLLIIIIALALAQKKFTGK